MLRQLATLLLVDRHTAYTLNPANKLPSLTLTAERHESYTTVITLLE